MHIAHFVYVVNKQIIYIYYDMSQKTNVKYKNWYHLPFLDANICLFVHQQTTI